MKKLLLTLFLALWGSSLNAERITQYDVNITVLGSGELQVTERILYDFEQNSRHGIFRDIPITVKGAGQPKDIGLREFYVQMDDDIAEWAQSTLKSSDAGEMIRLKIGSASVYITGQHLYTIGYIVAKGVLPSSEDSSQDAVRWNTIGTGWEVPIDHAKIDMYLPSPLNKSNVSAKVRGSLRIGTA